MQDFVLALTLILAVTSMIVSSIALYSCMRLKQSVPDKQAFDKLEKSVVKLESPKLAPEEKWNKLKEAFKPSGTINERSRTS